MNKLLFGLLLVNLTSNSFGFDQTPIVDDTERAAAFVDGTKQLLENAKQSIGEAIKKSEFVVADTLSASNSKKTVSEYIASVKKMLGDKTEAGLKFTGNHKVVTIAVVGTVAVVTAAIYFAKKNHAKKKTKNLNS